LLLFFSLAFPPALAAMAGGAIAGIALAMVGLHHTKFENTREGRFYIPHTYTGLVVTALFLGRMCYRLLVIYPQMRAAATDDQSPMGNLQHSPLNALVFGLLIGYYIYFNVGVLRRSQLAPLEPAPSAPESTTSA
jgi:cytochrome b561